MADVHEDGVFWEVGMWVAYVDGQVVASGPDKPIIEAAWKFHDEEDLG